MSEEREEEGRSPEEAPKIPDMSEGATPGQETAPEEELSRKAAVQAKELQELQDRHLRLVAEFDNYRKRVVRDRAELVRTAQEGLLLDLLPVLDNLERALAAARSSATSSRAEEAVIEGVDLTLRLFKGVLEKAGVKAIESVEQQFDPTVHHAVEQVQTNDHPENTVVEEVLRGYVLDQKVLRPALVKVSSVPATPPQAETTSEGTKSE